MKESEYFPYVKGQQGSTGTSRNESQSAQNLGLMQYKKPHTELVK